MNYCSMCIIPITRPDQNFDEKNICNACNSYLNRDKINWDARSKSLLKIIEDAKKK